jgi:hypothetical protein
VFLVYLDDRTLIGFMVKGYLIFRAHEVEAGSVRAYYLPSSISRSLKYKEDVMRQDGTQHSPTQLCRTCLFKMKFSLSILSVLAAVGLVTADLPVLGEYATLLKNCQDGGSNVVSKALRSLCHDFY